MQVQHAGQHQPQGPEDESGCLPTALCLGDRSALLGPNQAEEHVPHQGHRQSQGDRSILVRRATTLECTT